MGSSGAVTQAYIAEVLFKADNIKMVNNLTLGSIFGIILGPLLGLAVQQSNF
jgi:hypothetical protein